MNKKRKILVADDDANIVRVTKSRLESIGYEVIIARDGLECLQMIHSEKIDLLILDIGMPKMDGFTVVKELKADPRTAHIPILILSGKSDTKDLLELEGIAGFVPKPFKPEDLLGRIESAFAAQGSA